MDASMQDRKEQAQFYARQIYGSLAGWIELSIIDGDPRYEQKQVKGFYKLPRQFDALIHDAIELSEQYGNVYVSTTRHETRRRTLKTALPSLWLFVDDVKQPSDDFTMVVQTSQNSYHGYYKLNRPVNMEERATLQRRLRIFHNGDKASANAVLPARIPGTFNTKAHGRFPVAIERYTGRIHDVDELLATLPPAPEITSTFNIKVDEKAVARAYGNIDATERHLKNKGGLPQYALAAIEDDGLDNSSKRYRVVVGLLCRGIADEEIIAYMHALHDAGKMDWGKSDGKGATWKDKELARCIAKGKEQFRNKYGRDVCQVASTILKEKPAIALHKSTARADRPQKADADSYLAWLEEQASSGVALVTQRLAAEHFGVSVKTIRRIEERLTIRGLIQRETKRHDTWVKGFFRNCRGRH